jgi:hypothetical protein
MPGQWTIYVIDNESGTTLHELPFNVNTATSYNAGPEADISVTAISNTVLNISLDVRDTEGDAIEVVWHPQNNQSGTSITDNASDGDTVSRDISFITASTHTIFIELRDDSVRYDGSNPGSSGSGDGF